MFPYSDIRENRHPEAQKNEDVLQLVQAYVKFIQTDILYLFSIPSTGIIHIDFLGSVIQRLAEYKNIFKTLQCTMVLRSVEDIEPLIQWYIHYSITLVHTSGSTPRIP